MPRANNCPARSPALDTIFTSVKAPYTTGVVKNRGKFSRVGYISWVDPQTAEMQQLLWVDPSQKPTIRDLGPVPQNMSLREFIQSKTYHLAYGKRPTSPLCSEKNLKGTKRIWRS